MKNRRSNGDMPYPKLTEGFRDNVVIVLGGASGIGEETAKHFWNQGAQVYVVGLMPVPTSVRKNGDEYAEQYKQRKIEQLLEGMPAISGKHPAHQARFVECDVTKQVSAQESGEGQDKLVLQQVIRQIAKEHGHINVLVDSVGYRPQLDSKDLTPNEAAKVMAINAGHVKFILDEKFLAPLMKEAENGGRVVMINSTLPHGNKDPAAGTYAEAKAARLSSTLTASHVLGPNHGISVVTVSPGHVPTEAEVEMLGPEKAAQVEKEAVDGRLVKTSLSSDTVAKWILWGASDMGKVISGQEIQIGTRGAKIMPTLTMSNDAEAAHQAGQLSRQETLIQEFVDQGAKVLRQTQRSLSAANRKLGRREAQLEAAQRTIDGLTAAMAEYGISVNADHRRGDIHAMPTRAVANQSQRAVALPVPAGANGGAK